MQDRPRTALDWTPVTRLRAPWSVTIAPILVASVTRHAQADLRSSRAGASGRCASFVLAVVLFCRRDGLLDALCNAAVVISGCVWCFICDDRALLTRRSQRTRNARLGPAQPCYATGELHLRPSCPSPS